MPARKKSGPSENREELNFENALAKIEDIVESMEGEQLPLEDLVAQYEAGSALLKHCEAVLASARKRIELITRANREETAEEDSDNFAQTSQNTPIKTDGDPDDDNDISLF